MPVTELARLIVQPGTDVLSPELLANLAKAKDAMQQASGSNFWYYQCVEDPDVIFILGSWPSVDFHMLEFIPGQPNQEILALLKDQVTVEWMFHLDIDQRTHPLPINRNTIAIVRHFISAEQDEAFQSTFESNKDTLVSFIGAADHVSAGWRVDRGYDPSVEGDRIGKEFVLFSAWDSVEHHHDFGRTEESQQYGRIFNHIDGLEIKHAKVLDVEGQGRK